MNNKGKLEGANSVRKFFSFITKHITHFPVNMEVSPFTRGGEICHHGFGLPIVVMIKRLL